MTLEETIASIEGTIDALNNEVPKELSRLALTSKAKIQSRVQEGGIKGAKYSDNPLPDYYFFDNSPQGTTVGGKANVKKAIKNAKGNGKSGLSYREYKDVVLGVDKVNLTLSGDMWNNIDIINESKSNSIFTVTVGGKTDRAKELIGRNANRYGDFLTLTPEEEREIDNAVSKKIDDIFDRFL